MEIGGVNRGLVNSLGSLRRYSTPPNIPQLWHTQGVWGPGRNFIHRMSFLRLREQRWEVGEGGSEIAGRRKAKSA